MRNLYRILITLVLLLSMAVNAVALEQKSMNRYSSEYAEASWSEVVGNRTINNQLSLTRTDDGTSIYFNAYTSGPGYWSNEWGSTYTQDNVFRMSKNLDSASLSEIEMEVYYYSYDEMGIYTSGTKILNIKADWVGVGEVSESSSKYVSKQNDCTSKNSESYLSRQAKATGSINNFNFETSSYAWLSSSKRISTNMEK